MPQWWCILGFVGAPLTDFDGALDDHGAVGLVGDAIDLLQVVRVRDDLVVADDVLCGMRGQPQVSLSSSSKGGSASPRDAVPTAYSP